MTTLREALELEERRAKAIEDAEAAKLPPDKVRAMERDAGQQGWSLGQAWTYRQTSPWWSDDGGDTRLCRVSVDALAEAMRLRRLERDGSPCWSPAEARELLDEAMRCELELLPADHGWMPATHAKRARERRRAAKACGN